MSEGVMVSVWAKALSLLFSPDYFMREIKGRERLEQHVSQNFNWGLFLLLQPIMRLYLSWNVAILFSHDRDHYRCLSSKSIFPMGICSEDIYIASGLHNACGVISIDYWIYDGPCWSRKQINLHYCIEIHIISWWSLEGMQY